MRKKSTLFGIGLGLSGILFASSALSNDISIKEKLGDFSYISFRYDENKAICAVAFQSNNFSEHELSNGQIYVDKYCDGVVEGYSPTRLFGRDFRYVEESEIESMSTNYTRIRDTLIDVFREYVLIDSEIDLIEQLKEDKYFNLEFRSGRDDSIFLRYDSSRVSFVGVDFAGDGDFEQFKVGDCNYRNSVRCKIEDGIYVSR